MEGEKQCRLSLSEEIYSTLDSVLGGIRTGPGSPVTGARPVNAGASPAHQYGHLCQFHRLQAFQEETGMFQQVADDSPSAEESEHDTLGRAGERCSSKEHGPARASTPAVQSLLACACVWQPPPHSWGDSMEAAPPAQPRSHLSRESSPRAGQPCGQSNSAPCHLHAVTDASQEVVAAGHPQEPVDGGRESPWGRSPEGISCSGDFSRMEGPAWDSEGSEDSVPRAEEGLALNQVLRQLRRANREQHARIQSLQCCNAQLEKKVQELLASAADQRVMMDAMGQLKENVEALIEDKYRVLLEKHEVDHTLRDLHTVLASTQKHLQASRSDKEALELELKKVQASYVHLQEKYVAELQLSESLSLSAERDRACGQQEEAARLRQLRGVLERSASCARRLLRSEKLAREQELLALQEALWQHRREDLAEREEVQARLAQLGAQVQSLQSLSGKEAPLGPATAQSPPAQPDSQSLLQEPLRKPETDGTKATVDTEQPTEAPLSPSPRQEGWPGALDTSRGLQLAAKIHSVLGLMVNFLSRKGSSALDADGAGQRQDRGEREAESMARKLKHLQQTKKHLEQELMQHKQRISMLRQSVGDRKAAQDPAQATGFDSSDARSVGEVPVLLEAKLDQYHVLNQELDFLTAKLGSLLESKENPCGRLMEEKCKYQRQLGILMDKVTSYEEIIECADHRLAVSCSHITHLEERNRRLEDLLRRPRERAWRRRLRRLEVQSRSTDRVGSEDGHCPEGHIPV